MGDPVLRVEWQKLRQRLLLPAIKHVALKLCNDKGQTGDLGREVTQLNAKKVGERDFRAPVGSAAPTIALPSSQMLYASQ